MAIHLTGEQFEITKQLFKELDKDGDGSITVVEFKAQILQAKKLGNEKAEDVEDYVQFLLRLYDMDDSGTIEFPEFLQIHAFVTYGVHPNDDYIKRLFLALDKDGKGFICVDDIKRFCRTFKSIDGVPYDETKVDELIKKLDTNGDGEINYSEFINNFSHFNKFENGY